MPEARIRTIWSAVDPEAMVPKRAREDVRRELGCVPNQVVLLAVGSLVPRKGLDLLLGSLHVLRTQPVLLASSEIAAPPWSLWIAGDGPERAKLEDAARSFELTDRVLFLGGRFELRSAPGRGTRIEVELGLREENR